MKRILYLIISAVFCILALCACSAPAAPAAPAAETTPLPEAPAQAEAPAPAESAAPAYDYVSPQELYSLIEEDSTSLLLIDLQPEEYYSKYGHLQGAVSTKAYPAESDEQLAALDKAVSGAESSKRIVLIDMAGKAGAHNAFDYLASSVEDASKLCILEGGMMEWKYPEMVETDPGPYEYQILRAKDIRRSLRNGEPLIMIDFRENEAYELMHIKGSVNVPVADAAAYKSALGKALPLIAQDVSSPVVLLTADGGTGAKSYYDYFASRGVDASRLFILENGLDAWPEDYRHYTVYQELPGETQEIVEAPLDIPPEESAEETEQQPEVIQYYG